MQCRKLLFISCCLMQSTLTTLASCNDRDRPPSVITNNLSMEFVRIDAGSFLQGSPDDEPDASALEKPQHKVVLTKRFYMSRCEVTVGQFEKFALDKKYISDAESSQNGGYGLDTQRNELSNGRVFSWKSTGFLQNKDHPVVNVSWNDAVEFCKWLSARDNCTYRLPTEAEWEYAARAATSSWFHFGDNDRVCEFDNLCDSQFSREVPVADIAGRAMCDDGAAYTTKVGSYKRSKWGLNDLHGNVREWCSDWVTPYHQGEITDPVGKESGVDKVVRGGSWLTVPIKSRSSVRNGLDPKECDCDLGFRLIREAEEKPESPGDDGG